MVNGELRRDDKMENGRTGSVKRQKARREVEAEANHATGHCQGARWTLETW